MTPLLARVFGLAAVLLGVGALWAVGTATLNPKPPAPIAALGPLPTLQATTLNGQPFAGWGSIAQPALLITFWASWCSVCMAELPSKMSYAQTHPRVALVAINIDAQAPTYQKALAKLNPPAAPNIIWLHDATQQGAYAPMQVAGVPETFVANAQRHILAKHNGPTHLVYGPLAAALQTAQAPAP